MSKKRQPTLFFLTVVIALISFSVNAQPSVIGHPADSSICVDASASFRVIALNTAAYQWQENDGVGWYNITATLGYASGFNTPLLTIHDANLGLNGYLYRCVVFDAGGLSAFSNPAELGVYDPPIILDQPTDTRVCKNTTAVFSVNTLNGTDYGWQENIGAGWVYLDNNAFYQGVNTEVLEVFTTTGMNGFRYRCVIKNVSCPDTTISVRLFVDPTPIIQQMTGGGSYCTGEQGVEIGLASSETGISYQLYRNTVSTGIVREGNGSPLSFGIIAQAGTYTVKGYNGFTGCEIDMEGQKEVSVDPLPQQQQLMGGGAYCVGSQSPELYLSGSQANVQYVLYRNGVETGVQADGTGYVLSFGHFEEPGLYSVVATNIVTGCSVQIANQKQITRNALPVANAGINQSIVRGSVAALAGTASAGQGSYQFNWQPEAFIINPSSANTPTIPLFQSRYFILKVKDNATTCMSRPDTVLVQVTDGPFSANISSSATQVCQNEIVTLSVVTSGGSGNYSFQWSSLPGGFNAVTSSVNVSPNQTTTYFVVVSDGQQTVNLATTIIVNPSPSVQTLSGDGAYCTGSEGSNMILSFSEAGVTYQLFRNNQLVTEKQGTGQLVEFGLFTVPGTYTATAVYGNNGCSIEMDGEIVVLVLPLPVATVGQNQYITQGGQTTLNGNASGGSGNFQFQWSPASSLINPNAQNPGTLPLYQTTLFQLTATDQQSGCQSDPAQTVVFVTGGNLSLAMQASSYSVCPETPVQLEAIPTGGSGSYTYQWQSIPAGYSSTLRNPVVSPQVTTTYFVMVTDGFNVVNDSIEVTVRGVPLPFEMIGGGSYCSGGQGVEVKLSGSESSVYYHLYRDGEETGNVKLGTSGPISFGFQTASGVYESRAFSSVNLCENEMDGNVSVVQNNRPQAYAGVDRTILSGTATNLNGQASGGSGNYAFSWQPTNMVINPNAQQSLTTPLSSSTFFRLTVTDGQTGCQSSADTVKVFVQGNTLSVSLSATETSICYGQETTLNAIASGGTGNYYYSWTSIPAGFYSSQQSPTVNPVAETVYQLTVFDGINSVQASISISVSPLPQVYDLTGGGTICQSSDKLPVGLSGSEFMTSYQLFRNNEFLTTAVGTGSALNFGIFGEPGEYIVFASSAEGGCNVQMSGIAVIESTSSPIANAGPDRFLSAPGQVTLDGEIIGAGNADFWWNPAAKLLNPEAIQPTSVVLNQTALFSLETATVNCGGSTDYATVFVGGGDFDVQIVHTNVGCEGQEVQLFALATGGSGNYSYQWVADMGGFSSTVYDPIVNPIQPTRYTVYVNDGSQVKSDSVLIVPFQNPNIYSLSGGGNLCGTANQSDVNLSGSQTGVDYSLIKNNVQTDFILSGTGSALTFEVAAETATYQVLAINSATACSALMNGSASVTVSELPVVEASPDQNIASGETTVLSATATGGSGSYNYLWTPSWLVEQPMQANTNTLPIETTTLFFVEATDQTTGCTSEADTLIVYTIGGQLSARIISKTEQLCEGDVFEAYALAGGGTGDYTYIWLNDTGVLIGSSAQLAYIPEQSGFIFLQVQDGSQQVSDSVFVEIKALPELFTVSGGGSYCLSADAPEIVLNGSEPGVNYTLYTGQQAIITIVGQGFPINFGNQPQEGSYHVEASQTGFSCSRLMAGNAVVQRIEPPLANAGFDQEIPVGTATTLQASVSQGSGTYSYLWNPEMLVLEPNQSTTATEVLNFSAMFSLRVTDTETGCFASDDMVVIVQGGPIQLELIVEKLQACPGEQVSLTALPSGGSGNYQWSWWSNPIGLQGNSRSVEFILETNTWVFAQVTDGENTALDSVFIRTFTLPQSFSLSGGGSWCENEQPPSVFLDDSEPSVNYKLYRNGLASGVIRTGTGNTIDFGPQWASGNYTALATNSNQCIQLMEGLVSIRQGVKPLKFNVLGGGVGCENDLKTGIYLSGSQKGVEYHLLLDGMVKDTQTGTDGPVSFNTLPETGVYTVQAMHLQTACTAEMKGQASMLVYPTPTISVQGELAQCATSFFNLSASGADQYIWKLNPDLQGNQVEFEAQQDQDLLVIGTNSLGCSDSLVLALTVFEKPEAALMVDETLLTATALPEGMQQYRFFTGETILQDGAMRQFYFGDARLENDSLYVLVVSKDGCADKSEIFVEPFDEANAFTPNGDLINDVFLKGVFIRVFSRWGVELFAGNEGWDGTYKGALVSPGTYYYVKEVRDAHGNLLRTVKGSVTLVIE